MLMACCSEICFPVLAAVAALGWFLWLLTLSRWVRGNEVEKGVPVDRTPAAALAK